MFQHSVLSEPQAPRAQQSTTQDELEDLIYLISHDLRSSLRALLEVPGWIEEDLTDIGIRLPETLTENVQLMNTHTRRLDRMLCDLLAFSRVGRMQRKTDVNLHAIVDEVIESLPVPSGFKVERDFQWDGLRFGERDIVTLVHALVSNGIKHHHAKRGRILIQTRMEGDIPVLYVSDDGPGIDDKFSEIVFDIMQTLKPREEVEGSGMGLAIGRKIATTYGGTMRLVDPVLDVGTTIKTTFAAAK